MITTTSAALSPELLAQLDQLKDVRLPQAVSWWPLAPGWWLLTAIFLSLLITVLVIFAIRRSSLKYVALRELNSLRIQDSDKISILQLGSKISILLRRITLHSKNSNCPASVQGEVWEQYLARQPGGMKRPIARFIAMAPYISETTVSSLSDMEIPEKTTVLSVAENWIRRNA
ncbi:MAG: DUF4381 domain-containing protein [Alphaproteobacteria bacterium]|nr:DUF4381 domain-containing protein [Alphaproteobacteria bacterium]